MGFFDDKDPFDGLFDFNRDDKMSGDEEWLAFEIFEECTKKETGSGAVPQYNWRDDCDEGLEFGLDPEEYETREEYEEALEEAKYAWRDDCDDGYEENLDPEDYETEEEYKEALEEARENAVLEELSLSLTITIPAFDRLEAIKESDFPNKRRYNAAYALAADFVQYRDEAYERREKACCKFILEKADTVLAAHYLSYDGGFLYAQAVKDNFSLPVHLPDEDETSEYEFAQMICKIAKKDIPLSFQVWEWCLAQFLPYAKHDENAVNNMTTQAIDNLYGFPEDFSAALVRYMDEHADFRKKIVGRGNPLAGGLPELIAEAIKNDLHQTAKALFKSGLSQANGQWKDINTLTDDLISECKNDEELESIEYFEKKLLPLVKAIDIGMVQDEIEDWEKEIAAYIEEMERECERYAFCRKNAWRNTVPSGEKYGLNPRYYDSEQEYLAALHERKYGWRKWYEDKDNEGLNPEAFETQDAFNEARAARWREKKSAALAGGRRNGREQTPDPAAAEDQNIYIYCGVAFPDARHAYHYRTDDTTIQIGDTVIVPVGDERNERTETKGIVVSVGQYTRMSVPYPVEKTRFILRKVEGEKR